jgi:hypothetical protein
MATVGTGPAIGIWYLVGLVLLGYRYARHPERLPEMKRAFADDAPSATDQPVASVGAA